MLLYYITDRRQLHGTGAEQRSALLDKISQAARCGVDYIQLREKDLTSRELLGLAEEARERIQAARQNAVQASVPVAGTRNPQPATRLLINSRVDVALAGGAHGVHLRGDDISAADARAVAGQAGVAGHWPLAADQFIVACSCHSREDVRRAESDGADFVVFAPVFGKGAVAGVGLDALRAACRGTGAANTPEPSPAVRVPVLALGGVTLDNVSACRQAGAAGVAGIRLFQDNDIAQVVARLRAT